MAYTERQRDADRRYRAAKTETLNVIIKRSERMSEMIGIAAERRHMTRRAWMLDAYRQALARDGVTLDTLPPVSAAGPVEAADDDGGGG